MNAAYLIPAFPLAGFVLLLVFGRLLGKPLAGVLATVAMAGSFVSAVVTFFALLSRHEAARSVTKNVFTWLPVGGLDVHVAFLIDPLSITMALFVTGVGMLIHLYSIGYMAHDDRFPRFFTILNLFAFSMLLLVLANNMVLLFLGWEGVGACSYLLVSFWFTRERAASAGKKAFVVNRVGDFGYMLAMFLVFETLGSLTFKTAFSHLGGIHQSTATAIALLAFVGCCGKSAQLPLYVWLPDAMEGPTPVSALIHAATMVTAGIYLLARLSPLLAHAPDALTVVAWVGVLTALFAATIACAQDDIKRVLAYSTISQLGYMFLAVGAGWYTAGLFHMITHAFFKALLFLAAGSVIHGMHDEQDMKRMGGLRPWMPITGVTFLIGWLAISGIPPFAGFWSKDDILLAAWHKSPALWVIGVFTAGLTAYYMSRQVALTFFGAERWRDVPVAEHHEATGAGATEPEPPVAEQDTGHGDAHAGAHGEHGAEPHESPWTMTVPLIVLAALSVVGGVLNLPWGKWDFLERWLDPVLGQFNANLGISTSGKVVFAVIATVVALIGLAAGLGIWQRADNPQLEPAVLRNGWFVDLLYANIIEKPGALFSNFLAWVFDRKVIDGAVNGVATGVRDAGGGLRRLQTGYVRNYALGVAGGTVLLLAYILVRVGV